MTAAKILLIDDHAMFRSGLRMVIESGIRGAEVYEAGSVADALHCEAAPPDVVLLDINLPGLNGMESIQLLKRKWPLANVLVLSSQDDAETERLVLARGAACFVSKANTAEKIIETVNLALNKQVSAKMEKILSREEARIEAFKHLTPRQCEVLDMMCRGMSNKLIARQLALSENTVRVHVQAILLFLRVTSRSEAIFAARHLGLIS
jgi:DNA-binding NarL/FixJ family response regulator